MSTHIAIDLGASNGRVIVGDVGSFEVVHRFITRNIRILDTTYWDILYIYGEIRQGIKKAVDLYGSEIISIGVDTWGVDHLLLDEHKAPLTFAYHYRDGRTDRKIEELSELYGQEHIYQETGIAFQPFNTLYQLVALNEQRPELLQSARYYLSIPDVITYWLTGVITNETTHASTTQLFDPKKMVWNRKFIREVGLNPDIFPPVIPSGTVVGPLESVIKAELGLDHDIQVVAVGTHDTASAVAAVPAKEGEDVLYISSGTWSLLGIEADAPILTDRAREAGFTNEVGVNGRIRFLKNIMGMWIQQECVRNWERKGETIDYADLDQETLDQAGYDGYIDVMDEMFLKPNSPDSLMEERVKKSCENLGFRAPETHGEVMVAVYRGLAKAYHKSLREIEEITGRSFRRIHIIGGGCKNEILDTWTAQETGREVVAGPVEATALGNLLVQMNAMQTIPSLASGREIITERQKVKVFTP